jgi:hypothetical protein
MALNSEKVLDKRERFSRRANALAKPQLRVRALREQVVVRGYEDVVVEVFMGLERDC